MPVYFYIELRFFNDVRLNFSLNDRLSKSSMLK
jgi:hypothetical protein